jgi:hypothetical protein
MDTLHRLQGFPNAAALEINALSNASQAMALPEETIGRIFSALAPDERPDWIHERILTASMEHHGVQMTRSEARDLGHRLMVHSKIDAFRH